MLNLPPLNYLRSFEAAARTLSFTAAGAELNLTQAAVSGHIRALEQYIGGRLFTRHARSLSLTSLGTAYLPSVSQAMGQIAQATETVRKQRGGRKIVVSCPVSLANSWMASVIARFGCDYGDASVTLHARIWEDDAPDIADIILTSRHEMALTRQDIWLWRDEMVVVCAPSYQVSGAVLNDPAQLTQARLIYNLGRPESWNDILAHYGQIPGKPIQSTQTNAFSNALALASEGYGVAAVPRRMVQSYLDRGLLKAPFGQGFPSPWIMTLSDGSLLTSEPARALHEAIINAARNAAAKAHS